MVDVPFRVCSRVRTWFIALNTRSCFWLFPPSLVVFLRVSLAPPQLHSTWVPGSCSVRLWLSRFGRHFFHQKTQDEVARIRRHCLFYPRSFYLASCFIYRGMAVDTKMFRTLCVIRIGDMRGLLRIYPVVNTLEISQQTSQTSSTLNLNIVWTHTDILRLVVRTDHWCTVLVHRAEDIMSFLTPDFCSIWVSGRCSPASSGERAQQLELLE